MDSLQKQRQLILITGAAGFIGSYLTSFLNAKDIEALVISDDFSVEKKKQNWSGKKYQHAVERSKLFDWLSTHADEIGFVFHLGARTDTTENSEKIFQELNLNYSKELWQFCCHHGVPFVYASSAATYGNGENGYADNHVLLHNLKPLNPYGQSKHDFDIWALAQSQKPPQWVGLKFFNVYGPNEYHKRRMASVIFHAYHQIKEKGHLKLFRSHREDYRDGEQKRDFIYVHDIAEICFYMLEHQPANGLYNAGTGKAETFLELADAVFEAMGKRPKIDFIDIPEDIRETYQYFTQADMRKLKAEGYNKEMYALRDGIKTYVEQFLRSGLYV